METTPTVQVSTNGILGGCFNLNCEYNTNDATTPTVTSYTYTPEAALTLEISTPLPPTTTTVDLFAAEVDTLAEEIFAAINAVRADPTSLIP